MADLSVWRHPRPVAVEGLCIGRTDAPVDRRKSKRLAHRIRRWARRHGLARVVVTSPLRRGADVGRWLARWGWRHLVDKRLIELDFGAWDGEPWQEIPRVEIDAWCAAFEHRPPGGGETVASLLARCAAFIADAPAACIVGHAGWISAARWLSAAKGLSPQASSWPAAVDYGERVALTPAASPAASASSPAGSACSTPTARPAPCRPRR
ncbi:MAG: histidine phosphatase family protein [Burkholderiales bacterium]